MEKINHPTVMRQNSTDYSRCDRKRTQTAISHFIILEIVSRYPAIYSHIIFIHPITSPPAFHSAVRRRYFKGLKSIKREGGGGTPHRDAKFRSLKRFDLLVQLIEILWQLRSRRWRRSGSVRTLSMSNSFSFGRK